MNPVRGGSPPNDSRTRGVIEVRAGAFAHEAAKELMFVVSLVLKIINVEKVITR